MIVNINELLAPDVFVPFLIGLCVVWLVLKAVKRVINRVITLVATAIILGGSQHLGALMGLIISHISYTNKNIALIIV